MARHRSDSIEFTREVAQEHLGGESLNGHCQVEVQSIRVMG